MPVKAKISNSTVKTLKPSDKRLNDTDISGFHARITDNGKIKYYLFYRLNGKQVNYLLGADGQITPAQARDLAKDKIAEVTKGIDVQAVKKDAKEQVKLSKLSTLLAFVDQKYAPWLTTRNPKTAKQAIHNLKVAFPNFLNLQLSAITAWEVEKWRSDKKAADLKPASINRRLNTLKGCLSRAVEWEIIDGHDLNKVKALKVDNSKVRYLDKGEELRLREALRARDAKIKEQRNSANKFREERNYEQLHDLSINTFADYLEPIVLLAMNTGMRRGEILSLEWQNVDLTNRNLTIISDNAKSGKTRHIPLNTEAFQTLNNWKLDSGSLGALFKGQNGKPLLEIRKSWETVLDMAKIENFRFHDLRHHFASRLVMASVDLNTVRELLGHSDLTMTLRYAHLAPEHKAAAVNLIG
ncbi:site-specific integrase [Paraglaciecola hydrolytica]|uniref:Integrase n=1 Tax=Paraglaciecola hydrolytica TaxID=1799789 RepID=A0A148KKI3_9ALTE|nr:site-specific integrase [Paraglaciecola hydrolytica]KXI26790.1 integrase [Paraglaciecola hydrolytica]